MTTDTAFLRTLTWFAFVAGGLSYSLTGSVRGAELPRAGMLIEAEDFTCRQPDDGSFAVTRDLPNTSGSGALLKFFPRTGQCLYAFTISKAGSYSGWLRYAATGRISLAVGLDTDDKSKWARVRLPVTGALEGAGAWKWYRIFQTRLTKGPHRLSLGGAAIRPDCFFISSTGQRPTDTLLSRKLRPPADERTRRLLARPIEMIHPVWLNDARHYKLPAWYDRWRVCAHTRLSIRYAKRPIFLSAAKKFRSLGFHVFARHIKSGGEGAWWPSAVGTVLPLPKQHNWAGQIIDSAHKQNLRILVYHRHMEDDAMARKHPDWICRDWRGKPLSSRRGQYMCFNSPYVDYVLKRMQELADMGADGLYYDEVHMPKSGCWCRFCRAKFTAQTGLIHPRRRDPRDPVWQKLIDFNNATIERAFLKWRAALHQRHPQLVMLVGSNTFPAMNNRHLTGRLLRISDSVKTEFSLAARRGNNRIFSQSSEFWPPPRDARMALGWDIARDAADGRPPHVWCHGLLNGTSARYATAGMIAHGCIANLDHPENTIPDADKFAAAVAMGNRVSTYLAGLRPLRWAAIHFSERARDHYLPDEAEAWRKMLYPIFGSYLALLRAHRPVGIVTDNQLEEETSLDGYRVLFLPAPDQLTDRMRQVIAHFELSGGLVIRQRAGWQWHSRGPNREQTAAAFLKRADAAKPVSPVQVSGGPEKLHVVSFGSRAQKRITVALANDFSWLWTGTLSKAPAEVRREALKAQPPPPCRSVRVVFRGVGHPRKLFEAVSGKPLTATSTAEGLEILLPDFDAMAVVVAEF